MRQQKAPPPTAAVQRYPAVGQRLPVGDTLFVDASRGVAGDMLLAALLDLGISANRIVAPLEGSLPPFDLEYTHETRRGLKVGRIHVRTLESHPPRRGLQDVLTLIDASALPEPVKSLGRQVFQELAGAEGAVHGIPADTVHFHEVGALDSLVDTLGVLLAIHCLGIRRVVSSPIALGSGTLHAAHGVYPVPAPATLALCEGLPTTPFPAAREVSTPTGVTLLRVLAKEFGAIPAGTIQGVGYGAGTRVAEPDEPPNVLRCIRLQSGTEESTRDRVAVLETNLDTSTGEELGHLIDRLMARGALDAFLVATVQKKSRPGHLLTVLAELHTVSDIEDLIFAETGTLGIRRRESDRRVLRRQWGEVEVAGHRVRIKSAKLPDGTWVERPEHDDLRQVAEDSKFSVRTLRRMALEAWKNRALEGRGRSE